MTPYVRVLPFVFRFFSFLFFRACWKGVLVSQALTFGTLRFPVERKQRQANKHVEATRRVFPPRWRRYFLLIAGNFQKAIKTLCQGREHSEL